MLTWATDGDDKRTMVAKTDSGRTYLVHRHRCGGKSGYVGFRPNGYGQWPTKITDGGAPFKLRRDAMAACERHAAEGETQPCPNP